VRSREIDDNIAGSGRRLGQSLLEVRRLGGCLLSFKSTLQSSDFGWFGDLAERTHPATPLVGHDDPLANLKKNDLLTSRDRISSMNLNDPGRAFGGWHATHSTKNEPKTEQQRHDTGQRAAHPHELHDCGKGSTRRSRFCRFCDLGLTTQRA